jgi:CRP-like cAMP-binding protein
MDASRLKSIPLFASLGKQDLEKVARQADEIDVREGARLTKQDGFAHEFAIIEDGTADVLKGDEKIAEMGPGDFFGEIGLHEESHRRTATVVATSPMTLIVMFERDFRQMERDLPAVADQIRKVMEERLARA